MWLMLAGCISVDAFYRRFERQWCERLQQCYPDGFDLLFEESRDCRELSELTENVAACLETHCRFAHARATDCILELDNASCGAFVDGSGYPSCAEVWTECDGGEEVCW